MRDYSFPYLVLQEATSPTPRNFNVSTKVFLMLFVSPSLVCYALQPLDMWYVLEAPRGKTTAAQAAAEKKLRRRQAGLADGSKAGASQGGDVDGVSEGVKSETNRRSSFIVYPELSVVCSFGYCRIAIARATEGGIVDAAHGHGRETMKPVEVFLLYRAVYPARWFASALLSLSFCPLVFELLPCCLSGQR